MLTSSSNQYLRPEYLTPLPTTLDAKKSPLALLAQTCSQIGADPPSQVNGTSKSLLNNSSNSSSSHDSNSNSQKSKSGGQNSAKPHHDHPTDHHRPRKLSQASSPHVSDKNFKKSQESSESSATRISPPVSASAPNTDEKSTPPSTPSSASKTTPESKAPTPNSSTANSPPAHPAHTKSGDTVATTTASKPAMTSAESITTSSGKLNLSGPLTFSTASSLDIALKHGLPFPGLYPPLPPVSSSAGTGIPPYLHSYARLKAAAASTGGASSNGDPHSLMSLSCRDPFCAGCQAGQHGLGFGLKSCPAGCLQCDHPKGPLGTGGPFGLPFLPGFGLPSSLASLYSNPSTAPSLSLQPYVCNWFVGETYCGKRFSSSDDLLQHLRSHTGLGGGSGSSQEAVQNLAAAAAAAGYPPPQALHPHHNLLGSAHGLLSRTYPTPPLSPLSSARFHPYSKSTGGSSGPLSLSNSSPALSGGLFPPGFPGLSHPAFSPYYPYSFYGQRLGGGAGSLHP